MNASTPSYDLQKYQVVLNAFIELRGRGVSVSTQDLEVLKSWAEDGLPPEMIVKALESFDEEYQKSGKRWSSSLKTLDRSVRRAIREFQSY